MKQFIKTKDGSIYERLETRDARSWEETLQRAKDDFIKIEMETKRAIAMLPDRYERGSIRKIIYAIEIEIKELKKLIK